ncbi:MAG TPA: ABC transporter ATP-binding protein [Ruminococcaceae bacterium]|nr:ABC transporter ATP-binding protein [Oscillospiraceae bacterium]
MIEFRNVTKRYGKTKAVDNISITLPKTGIHCLLGRNGAGKTTFMKLLAGHIEASGGAIKVGSKKISPSRMPENVNFVESGAVQFNMRVSALIDTAAGLQDGFDRGFAMRMLEFFELDGKKKFKQLSFGMKTMLSAIITLANNSDVILLDEPTLGFDAVMRNQFNTLLLESYQAHPRLIIVSTHLIDEIAKVNERLIIIHNGKVLVEAGMDELDEKAYTLSGTAELVMPLLNGLNCIGQTMVGSLVAAHVYDRRITPPHGVSVDSMSLSDFFINTVGGKKNAQ